MKFSILLFLSTFLLLPLALAQAEEVSGIDGTRRLVIDTAATAGAAVVIKKYANEKIPTLAESLRNNDAAAASLQQHGTVSGRFSTGPNAKKTIEEVFGKSDMNAGPGKYRVITPLTEEQRAAKLAQLNQKILEARKSQIINSSSIEGAKKADAKLLELTNQRRMLEMREQVFYNEEIVEVTRTSNPIKSIARNLRSGAESMQEIPLHASKISATVAREELTKKAKFVRFGGLGLIALSIYDAAKTSVDIKKSSTAEIADGTR